VCVCVCVCLYVCMSVVSVVCVCVCVCAKKKLLQFTMQIAAKKCGKEPNRYLNSNTAHLPPLAIMFCTFLVLWGRPVKRIPYSVSANKTFKQNSTLTENTYDCHFIVFQFSCKYNFYALRGIRINVSRSFLEFYT